jgi:pimeloyl-ACP methyl ester carboxylesterase
MTSSTDELLPLGNADLAIVFVHGFLDDRHTWDGVVNQLVTGVETIRVDLYGCGEQADASGPFSYDRLAAEVGAVVDRPGKPFVIVGQSMGAAIAELVAADRPGDSAQTRAPDPVPLAGTNLSDEAVEPALCSSTRMVGCGRYLRARVAVHRVAPADRDGRPRVDTWRRGSRPWPRASDGSATGSTSTRRRTPKPRWAWTSPAVAPVAADVTSGKRGPRLRPGPRSKQVHRV